MESDRQPSGRRADDPGTRRPPHLHGAGIAGQLLDDGVAAFRGAFEALLTSIERRRIAAATPE
jgi:hypothetical protein